MAAVFLSVLLSRVDLGMFVCLSTREKVDKPGIFIWSAHSDLWVWCNYCFFDYLIGKGQHTQDFYRRSIVFNCFGIWYRSGYAEAIS